MHIWLSFVCPYPSPVLSPYAFLFFLSLYCRPAAWLEGGMNAPPPHHNQYQYHPQYQGGPPMGHPGHPGHPGAYGWQQSQQQQARFGAESARRATTGGAAQSAQSGKDDKTSPFLSTVHSHPGFQPQKIGKGGTPVSITFLKYCWLYLKLYFKYSIYRVLYYTIVRICLWFKDQSHMEIKTLKTKNSVYTKLNKVTIIKLW